MNIKLNERDKDRLEAIAKRRSMSVEDCAMGLMQQSMSKWERSHSKTWLDEFLENQES